MSDPMGDPMGLGSHGSLNAAQQGYQQAHANTGNVGNAYQERQQQQPTGYTQPQHPIQVSKSKLVTDPFALSRQAPAQVHQAQPYLAQQVPPAVPGTQAAPGLAPHQPVLPVSTPQVVASGTMPVAGRPQGARIQQPMTGYASAPVVSQEERVKSFWGVGSQGDHVEAKLRSELQAVGTIEGRTGVLCKWAWRGYVEHVLDVLKDCTAEAQAYRIMHAALLMRLKRQKEATEQIESLQQSKAIAAKVLCAVGTFEWNERSTAVDLLYKLQGRLREHGGGGMFDLFGKPLSETSRRSWETTVLSLLVSCYASTGEYLLAIDICERAMKSKRFGNNVSILMQMTRLHLQVGDVDGARSLLEHIRSLTSAIKDASTKNGVKLVEGLVEYADSNYVRAMELFEQLYDATNMHDAPEDFTEDMLLDALFDISTPFKVTLTNNLALCYLNTCNLSKAIGLLEECIRRNPVQHMHRTIVFNLCTLYDLAIPRDQSQQAKKDLYMLAKLLRIQSRFEMQTDFRL
uniref:26S proteasome regulatory subunit Rpn7 N-terminal domain-containing protein n=1 Tax=Mucochytrium quahogii TaxID=96639 RepID=A0A7S2SQ46_9STRA|mmetsp:Transcript_17177/g.27758  ORF Transcript_17177/g.27758 Transcript_17177/m.27758 type:complete len:516 (+) Transcript_17177:1360-2907(+)